MTRVTYGTCPSPGCGKRVQLDARGQLRPHQVPIPKRTDPTKSERCMERVPQEPPT